MQHYVRLLRNSKCMQPACFLHVNYQLKNLEPSERKMVASTINDSPLVNATVEGVVLLPSAFSITLATLPSMTATHEFVVPRSIPMTAPFTLSELQKILINVYY